MAVTIVNTNVFVETVSGTSHTMALSLSAGSLRKVVVMALMDSTTTVSGITYDGSAMTAVNGATISNTTDGNVKAYTFYIDVADNVGAGSKNVVATTVANATAITLYGWQLASAATGTPEAEAETQWSTASTSATVSPVTTSGAAVLAGAVCSSAGSTWTWTGGTVTERTESNETAYTSAVADATGVSAGTATITANNNNGGTGNKCLVAVSVAESVAGPTITVQPVADTVILTNETTATFSVTATGTGTLLYDWELEDGVASGVYANLANGNGATWTGQTASSCTATLTAKTLSGRRVRCNVTDSNGTTTTNAVALTIFDGPQLTTFPATNGSGVSTATLTCDYVTGVGEAIEVAIVLPDGRVSVTTTTTA